MYRKIDMKYNFISLFDPDTGQYLRSGVIEDGKDTMKEPFMASYPELIDIGVMGHCIHGESGRCLKSGVQCYQNGLHENRPNMSLSDFRRIIFESREKVFQCALGGRGDVDQHEDFEQLLACCAACRIVPNFTTSGFALTPEKAAICGKYCGAVAVSWYRQDYTLKAIRMLLNAGVKTNIHYVLGKNSIEEATERLLCDSFPKGINGLLRISAAIKEIAAFDHNIDQYSYKHIAQAQSGVAFCLGSVISGESISAMAVENHREL